MRGMIDLSDIPLFLAVARHSSFVEASRRTKIPPSTVSRAVARLEDALGTRLFNRTSRRVSLTLAGERLSEQAGALTTKLEEILNDVSTKDARASGLVRVTAPVMTGAGRIGRSLMAFAEKHPDITLDLQLTNTVIDFSESGFDVAFRAGPVADESLVARKLWDVPFTLAGSKELVRRVLRGKRIVTPERLADLPAITTSAAPFRFVGPDGASHELSPRERFRVNDPRVAVEAAAKGLGIVRAPTEAVVAAGLLPLGCTLGRLEGRPVFAVFPSRRLLPTRVRLLVDWVLRDREAPALSRP